MKGSDLKTLREEVGISQKRLSDETGIPYGTISGIESKPEQTIKKVENLEKLRKYFISKGVLKNEVKNEVTPIPYSDYMMVEYVDLSASAGPLGGASVDFLPEAKTRLVPKEFDNGNYLVVRIGGDSMDDGTSISIPDGSEVLVKEHMLEPGEKLPIRNNLFVITSRDGNVFKQVVEHNLEQGYFKCHSYNKKYKDFIIPLDDVFQIFIYKKIVSIRPSIPEID